MNKNQKKLLLAYVACIFASLIYVPTEMHARIGTFFNGWNWIFNVSDPISLRTIIFEWIGITIILVALMYYFKD